MSLCLFVFKNYFLWQIQLFFILISAKVLLIDFFNMDLINRQVHNIKEISIRDSARFPYTTINLNQLSNLLLPYHPSDKMAYSQQQPWTIFDMDSSTVVLEEARLDKEPVINMGEIQIPHHYPLQEVNQDSVIQQRTFQNPGLFMRNNQQHQTLSGGQQNLGNLLL